MSNDVTSLPRHAAVAFAGRSARRAREQLRAVWPDLQELYVAPIDSAVEAAENPTVTSTAARAAAGGSHQIWTSYGAIDFAGGVWAYAALSGAYAAAAASAARGGAPSSDVIELTSLASKAAADIDSLRQYIHDDNDRAAITIALGGHVSTEKALANDLRLLLSLAKRDSWDDQTLLADDVFALNTTFDVENARGKANSILHVGAYLDSALLQYFARNPEGLYDVHPRKFEEIIAELLRQFGLDVTLLAETRDGGRDIIAVENTVAHSRYLIECKRYSRSRKIGVQLVRQLHGVTQMERATKGILVTTSSFTAPALAEIGKVSWRLEGRDFDGIVDWLRRYERMRMAAPIAREHLPNWAGY